MESDRSRRSQLAVRETDHTGMELPMQNRESVGSTSKALFQGLVEDVDQFFSTRVTSCEVATLGMSLRKQSCNMDLRNIQEH
jgi:hypothetical protein